MSFLDVLDEPLASMLQLELCNNPGVALWRRHPSNYKAHADSVDSHQQSHRILLCGMTLIGQVV